MVDVVIVRVKGRYNHFYRRIELPTNLQRYSLYVRSPDVDVPTLEEMLETFVPKKSILANSPLIIDTGRVADNGYVTVVFSLGTKELYDSFKAEDKILQEEYFYPNGGLKHTKYKEGIGYHTMNMLKKYQMIIHNHSRNKYSKLTARFKSIG